MRDRLKNSALTNSAEMTENEMRLKMLFDIGSILASAEAGGKAMPQILEIVCRSLRFEIGEFWSFKPGEDSICSRSN